MGNFKQDVLVPISVIIVALLLIVFSMVLFAPPKAERERREKARKQEMQLKDAQKPLAEIAHRLLPQMERRAAPLAQICWGAPVESSSPETIQYPYLQYGTIVGETALYGAPKYAEDAHPEHKIDLVGGDKYNNYTPFFFDLPDEFLLNPNVDISRVKTFVLIKREKAEREEYTSSSGEPAWEQTMSYRVCVVDKNSSAITALESFYPDARLPDAETVNRVVGGVRGAVEHGSADEINKRTENRIDVWLRSLP